MNLISSDALDFVKSNFQIGCLYKDPEKRMTLKEIVTHPFLNDKKPIRTRTELSKFAEMTKLSDASDDL